MADDEKMRMALVGGFILLVAVVVYKFTPRSTFAADGLSPRWDATAQQARTMHLPSLVLFTSDYCGWCRKLHESVLTRPDVANEINGHYMMATVDLTDQGPVAIERAQRFGISGIPVLIRFDANGHETARTSYRPAESMVQWLRKGKPGDKIAYTALRMNNTNPHKFTDTYEFDADFRGETLHYIEGTQRTRMIWTWSNGYTVYSDTLEPWLNADGSTTPLSDDDRRMILERVVKYGLEKQHVKIKVE